MNNIKKIDKIDLSIILPCLNEEKAIRLCLDNISGVIKNYTSATEIIVVDNNSTDKTAFIVKEYQKNNPLLNILLIEEKILGYGSAYLAGFNVAKGKNIFMADADLTYDFKEIPRFPNVQRDLAVVVDKSIQYEQLEKATQSLKINKLKNINLFDIFESEKLGTNKKSMAVSYTFSDPEKTMTDVEIDAVMNKIIASYEKELHAEIRK